MDLGAPFLLVGIALWFAIGAAIGVVEARRGHWHKGWVVLAVFGPLAIGLAKHAREREAEAGALLLETGEHRAGGLDVLVGLDGSPDALRATETVVEMLGPRLGHLTIASVLDFDTATAATEGPFVPAEGWPERRQAEESLRIAADEIGRRGIRPTTVLLVGDPPTALQDHAAEAGHDLVVVGTRGRGVTKLVFGSCASRIGRRGGVPILLVPPTEDASAPPSG